MSTPSYAEAAALSNRMDNFGQALKDPKYGGPGYKSYGPSPGGKMAPRYTKYIAEHPRYPDYIYPDDKDRDSYYAAKMDLAQTAPTGVVVASDKDIQYIIDKKNAQELALFKQFVEDSIPRGTPWAREFFERMMPGWYQSKIDIIQDKLSIINRFIDITIRGPQNIDDMFLLYQLYAGKITIPNTWQDVIRPTSQELAANKFASGLFNPKRWVKKEYRIARANQKYMANFVIPGIDLKGLITQAAHDALPANADDFADAWETRFKPFAGANITRDADTNRFPGSTGISRVRDLRDNSDGARGGFFNSDSSAPLGQPDPPAERARGFANYMDME